MHQDLIRVLICPETRLPVTPADKELVERVNAEIAKGRLKNRAGRVLERPIHGGLLREDAALLYPIVDEIPMMLIDEGIPLAQLEGLDAAGKSASR